MVSVFVVEVFTVLKEILAKSITEMGPKFGPLALFISIK